MKKVNVKFLKDRGEFKKGDIVEVSEDNFNALRATGYASCEKTQEKPTIDGGDLSKRQAEALKKKAEALSKKAKELEEDRK